MGRGLHTFRHHGAVERMGQAHDAAHQGTIALVVEHLAHEGLVDLHDLCRQALQIGER
ncbi:hypothetical protein D3C71_1091800 [compost metagenome]